MGKPLTLPNPIGDLARAVGGVQAIAGLCGGCSPSTIYRWAHDTAKIPDGKRKFLLQLMKKWKIEVEL